MTQNPGDFGLKLQKNADGHELMTTGPLTLYFRKIHNELRIASVREGFNQTESENLVWSRWALQREDFEVVLKPAMPDMQVVVKPDTPFRLSPGARVQIYTRIPIWITVHTSINPDHTLMEVPAVELSRTWIGELAQGKPGYWLQTRARREADFDSTEPHLAVATMNISNESGEDLLIEKINVLVERLSLFHHAGRFWTDEMDVLYKGSDQHSEIIMKGLAPAVAPQAVFVRSPRLPMKKSFAERIFKEINIFS